MQATIVVLPGDGVGPEVTHEAVRVLEAVAARRGHSFDFESHPIGGAAIDACGSALPPGTTAACQRAHAVLLGAVGGPKWSDPAAPVRPEQGLLALRKALNLFANLRPVTLHPALLDVSPLKADILQGTDIMVVRELTGGIYFGEKQRTATFASDLCTYSVEEIERVTRVAGTLARSRRRSIVSVDKANVLETSRLWRSTVESLLKTEFPDVKFEHMLVDAAAMHLIRRPSSFDVILTENMFGDILTDEASMLAGSLGLLPSASLGSGTQGLYEPIHGSAPDIAGQGVANPYGTILSAAMLLRHSLGLHEEAALVEKAVAEAIVAGVRTADIGGSGKAATTAQAGSAVVDRI
ncbi:3-isopropylmalate dehydrogenase [Steroidobacter denitrificans]|uniref:3-isopropylmalate dehydrogenase n=1 Tax=Steroidobacter denitrificans TaxID=465721 RepID=A0A127FBT1_STEDE|nr:3-isopropylmalate dehydrogenase [Steroidobacter denitrificans]AMN47058.1 3-isopropylmalate dehydrogenase [Steroidobacter denitrificans]